MPPVFGLSSPSKTRLWSCAEASGWRSRRRRARRRKPPRLAGTPPPPPRSRPSPVRRRTSSIAASASAMLCATTAPLAGGEPVGLDHDRRALRAHVVLGRGGRREAPIGGGRDAVGLAQVLGEALGAFEPRRRPVGPNALAPAAARSSTMPAQSGASGLDHDEVDLACPAERDHRRMVRDIERDEIALARSRHCPAHRRGARPAGSPRSSRRARAHALEPRRRMFMPVPPKR